MFLFCFKVTVIFYDFFAAGVTEVSDMTLTVDHKVQAQWGTGFYRIDPYKKVHVASGVESVQAIAYKKVYGSVCLMRW